MGDIGMNLGGAVFHDHFCGFAQGAGRVANIIHDDTNLPLDIPDHFHLGNLAGFGAAFVHNRQPAADPLRQITGTGHAANIGGNDCDLVHPVAKVVHDVQRENRRGI